MNLNEEVRSGYTVSAEMKKVWKVQMDLLKKLLEVCDKHHLKIWAEGGTLLGTIREQGYIPWDDDMDMDRRSRKCCVIGNRYRLSISSLLWQS